VPSLLKEDDSDILIGLTEQTGKLRNRSLITGRIFALRRVKCAPLLVVAQGNCYGMQGYLGRTSKTRSEVCKFSYHPRSVPRFLNIP
jgi:hypothetical protein